MPTVSLYFVALFIPVVQVPTITALIDTVLLHLVASNFECMVETLTNTDNETVPKTGRLCIKMQGGPGELAGINPR